MTFAALALVIASFAPQDAERTVSGAERDALFALLDRFDALDTSKLPFVRVATGRARLYIDEPWRNGYRYGFLKETKGTQFLVRYLELDSALLTRTPVGTPEYSSVGFEPVDLRTFADELAERVRRQHEPGNHDRDHCHRDTPMKSFTVALLAARACMRCGYEGHADRLLAAARATYRVPLLERYELKGDLRVWLELAFGERALSWDDLHALHEAWLQEWAADDSSKDVAARRGQLAAIVAKRRERTPRGDPPSDAELIEDLRDHCLPTDSGGWFEEPAFVASPPPAHAQRAFDLLVGRGLAAAPALIAALDNTSLTRSVSYCSRIGGAFEVRSLGRVAGDVLVAIAGERAADWNDWLANASRDGLRASVLRNLKSGSREAARAWMRHWPDDLEPLFEQALLAEPGARQLLSCEVLCSGPARAHQRALSLLRAEAVRAHPERVAACQRLWWFGDAFGYRSLVDDWRHARVSKNDVLDELRDVFEAGVAEAWPVLAADIDAADVRDALARALTRVSRQTVLRSMRLTDGATGEADVRTCLLRLLHDEQPADQYAIRTAAGQHVQLHAPTRADVAASTLWLLWPEEFPFEPAGTRRSRMRQIVWLRERAAGRTPPPIEPVPVEPALQQLMLAVRSGMLTEKAIERLETFGMPALPLVEDLLRERPRHSHASELAELAVRLANRVVDVTFEASAKDLTAVDQQAVRCLIGKPIDQRSLLQALVTVASSKAAAGKRTVLHVDRSGDGEGTTMRCELLDRGGSTFGVRVTAGSLTLTDTAFSTGTPLDSVAALEQHPSCLAAIPKALDAKSTTPVEITISLSPE